MAKTVIIGGSKGLGKAIIETAPDSSQPILSLSRHSDPGIDLSDRINIESKYEEIKRHLIEASYLFFTAGVGFQGNLNHQSLQSITAIIDTVLTGPLELLSHITSDRDKPLHLITIASTTSAKVRANETVYGTAKAGQAQLARNFHQELQQILPGSKSTLIHPGGMRTPFWDGTGADTSTYLEPQNVAEIIWDKVLNQSTDWAEFSIIRSDGQAVVIDGTPVVQFPN